MSEGSNLLDLTCHRTIRRKSRNFLFLEHVLRRHLLEFLIFNQRVPCKRSFTSGLQRQLNSGESDMYTD